MPVHKSESTPPPWLVWGVDSDLCTGIVPSCSVSTAIPNFYCCHYQLLVAIAVVTLLPSSVAGHHCHCQSLVAITYLCCHWQLLASVVICLSPLPLSVVCRYYHCQLPVVIAMAAVCKKIESSLMRYNIHQTESAYNLIKIITSFPYIS